MNSLILEADPMEGQGPFTYLWETGEISQEIMIPFALGDYMLTMTDATGCTAIINCHVKPWPDVVFFWGDPNGCEGDTLEIAMTWVRDTIENVQYLWSTGETTETIFVTEDMSWSLTLTDPATGCSLGVSQGNINFWPNPTAEIIGPTELFCGESITLTLDAGPLTHGIWEPGWEWGSSYTVTGPGIYSVIVWDPDIPICQAYDTIVISAGDISDPVLNGPPELCGGETATINVTNASEFETFLWNTGQSGSSITVTGAGSYTVTVAAEGGCTNTATITIASGGGLSLSTNPENATCSENNGSIDLAVNPAQSNQYLWSNGATSQDLMNIPAGNYIVTVTDPNGCTAIANETILNVPIDINITGNVIPNTSCSNNNGSISLLITPSTVPYDILWSNGSTSSDISGLSPGTYSVTVSTGLSCIETATFTVEDESDAADIESLIIPASCGEENGAVSITMTGGQAPFSYLWSSGETTSFINELSAGTYTVSVTDASGCTSISTVLVPNENPVINLSGNVFPNTSCSASNGEIDLTVNPPGPYTFIWSNSATEEDLVDLAAGEYSVTVSMGASCVMVASFIVQNQNIPFEIAGTTLPNTSCVFPNGSIHLDINPGGTYSYLWSDGSIAPDITNLEQGIYQVTVTNADNCSIPKSFEVLTSIELFTLSGVTIQNTSCQVPNGAIDLNITPAGAYSFSWSDGSNEEDIDGLDSGTYTVTVTNDEGCEEDATFSISDQFEGFDLIAVTQPNVSCTSPNGSVDLSLTPAGNYQFVWSNGNSDEDLTGLAEGSYSLTVTDANLCSATYDFVITDSISVPAISGSVMNEICNTGNGSIDISVNPVPVSYHWSTGAVTEDLSSLSSGLYSITVVDDYGCAVSDTFLVENTSNNFSLNGIVSDNSSCTTSNGYIDLTIQPAGNYTIRWSNGIDAEDLVSLNAGTYTVTVTDDTDCSSTASFVVQNIVTAPIISETIVSDTCGRGVGAIILEISGSVSNTFLWSDGSNDQKLEGVPEGIYSVTVTSMDGCTSTATFVIPNINSSFTINAVAVNNSSCSAPGGSIDLELLPAGVYDYLWSNAEITQDLVNLTAGQYYVTVSDQSGCISTAQFEIVDEFDFPELTIDVVPASCGFMNGRIDLTVSGPVIESIWWSNGMTTEDLVDIGSGSYHVTITSLDGCSVDTSINVLNQNSLFALEGFVYDDTSCIAASGSIQIDITPPGNYTFRWSHGESTEDIENLTSGVYTLSVTDSEGCSSSHSFVVQDLSEIPLFSEVIFAAKCGTSTGSIDLNFEEAGNLSFVWSTGDTSEDLENIPPGNYSVTVTGENGCVVSTDYIIEDTPAPRLTIDADLSGLVTEGMVVCSLTLDVPLSSIKSIQWSPWDVMSCTDDMCIEQILSVSGDTEVRATVIDTNGCLGTSSIMIRAVDDPLVFIPNVFSPNGDDVNDWVTVFANDQVEEVVVLEIFDRWGNKVFVNDHFPPNDQAYGWNGIFSGELMNPGVFAYRAVVRFLNGSERAYKGDVTLVR